MADRDTSAPRDSGERRQTAPREAGERRQAPQAQEGGYSSERRQAPAQSSYGGQRQAAPEESGGRRAAPPQDGYSDRRQSPPQGGYGDRRQAPSQGGYSDRRQAPPQGGYNDRRQAPPQGGYSDRRQASLQGGYSNRRQAPPQGGYNDRRQAPPSRRNDVIRCENCGEDYSITYKRCPFCDERPGRGGVSGRRVANTRGGGYGRPVNPIQVAGLVVSVLLIFTAMFIVFRFLGAPIFGGGTSSQGSSTSSSQNSSAGNANSSTGSQGSAKPNGSSSQPQQNPGTTTPNPPQIPNISGGQTIAVEGIILSKTDFSLAKGGTWELTAALTPSGAEGTVTWTSSNPSVATVNESGLVTNVNSGTANTRVTITAACGDVKAEAVVYCKPGSGGGTSAPSGTQGTINADGGLNVRSGPGREYDVVASASNGAKVTIQGEENGWYKIVYSGSNTGYVSKEFVSVG